MVGAAERVDAAAFAEQVRRRFGYAIAGASAIGAVLVFVFVAFALPAPPGIHHQSRLLLVNAAVFVVASGLGFPFAWRWSLGRWRNCVAWAYARRAPTERELELTLRFPLSQQEVPAMMWLVAAALFAGLNAPVSAELAFNVGITALLGLLVTCALAYLAGERLMRPLTALALTHGIPARPQLPGVTARALLAWSLGTGTVLVGLALIGVGALHESRFTRERLAILILVLSLAGALVGLATMVGLARSLSDPITGLRRAMGRVAAGELELEVAVDDGSEVGLLQAGFNRMVGGLRERERLRDLFGRQVGEDVVRHALERGVELGGEAREAAVLFVDLQGSTALAEARDPAEVVSVLNRFFAIVVDVVGAHDGWVNKFEGDAALCVFGVPLADRHCAGQALAAGRELCVRLTREVPEIKAGIGISAGRVVAGNVGAAKRFEYTVIGDPVNEAARLSDLAKSSPSGVLASEAALDRGGPEAERWRRDGEVRLRGRSGLTHLAAPR
jgi:adenylate cyclase